MHRIIWHDANAAFVINNGLSAFFMALASIVTQCLKISKEVSVSK